MPSFPEILAPAGGMPQLEAAVRSGADAVYLGASSMNARCSAVNFTDTELAEAAAYCHTRGVKLYLTMNTLMFDNELESADKLLALACRLHIDGIIVQDIGLASHIAKRAPSMRLHASTQCSIQSASGLRMLDRLGFCRAVLARELSAEELEEISQSSPMELEYFVHGALCMSVSGQCWLSSVIGQRSGNRGRCAQPCRLPFRDGSYMNCLSLKDSSLIRHIPKLAELGIASLKIEGRLKRPEYCAAVTDACVRQRDNLPDSIITDEDMERLASVFSRSGFTDGYFRGTDKNRCGRRDMFGIRTKNDVISGDNNVFAGIHGLYKKERSSVPVDMRLEGRDNEYILTVSDREGNRVQSSVVLPFQDNARTDAGNISEKVGTAARSKLQKTGGTPYYTGEPDIIIDKANAVLPPSAAGELRRTALELLSEKRAHPAPIEMKDTFSVRDIEPQPHIMKYPRRLDIVFRSAAQIPSTFPNSGSLTYGRAYLPLEMPIDKFEQAFSMLKEAGFEPAVECPRAMFGSDDRIAYLLEQKKSSGAGLCMAHNLGAVQLALDAGMECCGGFGLNITNTLSLNVLERIGLSDAELSFELTSAQIRALGGELPRSVIVYGRLPLMLTRCCPASLEKGCRGYSAEYVEHDGGNGKYCLITDRLGKDFPVMCREGCSEILNTAVLCMSDKLSEFSVVERLTARFTLESADEVDMVINCIISEKISPLLSERSTPSVSNSAITHGLYFRGVE